MEGCNLSHLKAASSGLDNAKNVLCLVTISYLQTSRYLLLFIGLLGNNYFTKFVAPILFFVFIVTNTQHLPKNANEVLLKTQSEC